MNLAIRVIKAIFKKRITPKRGKLAMNRLTLVCVTLFVAGVCAISHAQSYVYSKSFFATYNCLCLDSNANIFGSDGRGRGGYIYKSDRNGKAIARFNSSGTGQLLYPLGVATDASNNVYVVDNSTDRIEKYDNNGIFLSQFGSTGLGPGQLMTQCVSQ